MKLRNMRLMRKSSRRRSLLSTGVTTFNEPTAGAVSVTNPVEDGSGRINGHDLFSHYTADVLKEDVVYYK